VAFPDVATLALWFEPIDLHACASHGFVFRIYGVEWTHHSLYASQIVFHKDHAIRLRTLPIVDARAWFASNPEQAAVAA
jgi:hypothetical protein